MAIHPLRGLVAGMLGGLAASWVMNQMQAASQPELKPRGSSGGTGAMGGEPAQSAPSQPRESDQEEEDATVKTAQLVSQKVLHRKLTPSEKQIAGPLVHYAFGGLVGATYGVVAELLPGVGAGLGMPFGVVLWVLGDEIAVGALGLTKPPTEYPPRVHADALASHLLYGSTTDVLRRILRHVV